MGISKILVVGATGYLGPFITTASVRLGHPTFALVRPATARPDSSKNKLIEAFKASGTTILEVNTFNPQLFLSSILFLSLVKFRKDRTWVYLIRELTLSWSMISI
jgi:hypothetical protein